MKRFERQTNSILARARDFPAAPQRGEFELSAKLIRAESIQVSLDPRRNKLEKEKLLLEPYGESKAESKKRKLLALNLERHDPTLRYRIDPTEFSPPVEFRSRTELN